MGRDLNKTQLIGRLGNDPELKYTPQGQAVCSMTVATDESYKKDSGELVNKVEWHKIVLWRFLAENAGKYLKKGSQVYIEGKLQTRMWEKDSQKHYTTEIVASNMIFLGGKPDSGGDQQASQHQQNNIQNNQSTQYDMPDTNFDPNELPF